MFRYRSFLCPVHTRWSPVDPGDDATRHNGRATETPQLHCLSCTRRGERIFPRPLHVYSAACRETRRKEERIRVKGRDAERFPEHRYASPRETTTRLDSSSVVTRGLAFRPWVFSDSAVTLTICLNRMGKFKGQTYVMQLKVESAGIADRLPVVVSPPKGRVARSAIGALHTRSSHTRLKHRTARAGIASILLSR